MSNKDKELNQIKEELATVSKAFHELKTEKQNQNTRMWRTIAIVAIIAFVISNMLWLMHKMSLEKVTETTTETYTFEGIEQNAEGSNYIVGGDINGNTKD